MKTCTKCHTTKALEEFVRDKRRVDGHGSWCTLCNRKYMRVLIHTPKVQAARKAQYAANKESLNAQARARWAEKKDQYAAMDFDHVQGSKVTGIAQMWSWGRARVIEEINKCALVCANCHRERTQARRVQLRCPQAHESPCAYDRKRAAG
jgi:hypothetical protein